MNEFSPFKPFSFHGFDIIESRTPPKLQLSVSAPVSDKFRAEMNAWLVDMFGYQDNVVPKGMAYMFGNTIVMRPEFVVLLANIVA